MNEWIETKRVATALTAAAIMALAGCGDGSSGESTAGPAGESGEQPAATDAAQQAAATATDAFGDAANAAVNAGQQVVEEVASAVTAEGATSATPEGSLRIYLAAMASGEFEKALDVIHPDSPGYNQVLGMAGGIEQIRQKVADGETTSQMLALAVNVLTSAFQSASYEEVAVQPPNAQYEVTYDGQEDPFTLNLLQVEDQWLIQVPDGGVPIAVDRSMEMAQQLQRPAGPPDPAP
ncbi:MAG: hypothetical protein AAGI30_04875 [Planctomycetota bacterium]